MPCKIQITKEITNLVEKQTEPFMGLSLKSANKKVEKVNKFFKAKVAEFVMIGDIMDRVITIPESLVQIYYNNELKIEEKETARLLREEKKKEKKYIESKKKEWEENREYFENDEPFTRNFSNTKPNTIQGQQGTLFQNKSFEGIIASEKTIRDLAARISDRIGIPVKFESDRTKKYKGKIENNVAYVNLAYATLDTPIHEILGHPIIRAIRNRKSEDGSIEEYNNFMADYWDTHPEKSREEVEKYVEDTFKPTIKSSQLYENLLKELETGKGKEVLDRVKRDYVNKNQYNKEDFSIQEEEQFDINEGKRIKRFTVLNNKNPYAAQTIFKNIEDAKKELEKLSAIQPYTLEEQQEEAIVELMSLMVADKLNEKTDKNLISLLKQLLKQINEFIKSLLNTKELNINDIEADNTKFLIENKLKELIKNGTIKKEC